MDVHTYFFVAWSLSNTMEAEWIMKVLLTSIFTQCKPELFNSDRGSQFSFETIRISMDKKVRVIDNVFIKRFWRTIKYEKLYLFEFVIR